MAAGDYVVRRNNAETTEIPDAGSDLQLTWDTAVANVGSGITYSSGTFTLGETGHFLVLCSEQWGTTDTTANERTNVQMELTLAGSVLSPVGYSTGYVRRGFGSQEFINFSAAIINVASTTGNGDDLEVRVERIDDSTAGTVNRIADRSGITIIKLDDTWGYGRYESSAAFTPSATDNTRNTADIGTTTEQDSPFTRTGNVVDVASTNPVLAVYSFQNDDTDTLSGRTEMQGVIDLQGTEVAGTWSQTYGPRVTDNCDWGGMSNVFLLEPSSGDDVTLMLVSREDSDEDWFAALQLVELPSGTEAAIVEATTGDFNTAATNFTWDTAPRVDTAAFTHSAGDANIDVDNDGDYLVMASLAVTTDAGTAGARTVPAVQFRINTTDDETAGGSGYNRAGGTADHVGVNTATLLTGLSGTDSIYAHNDRLGTDTTTTTNTSGGMAVIRMDSLFSSSVTASPGAGSLALSGQQPSVGSAANATPGAGSLGLSGQAPTVGIGITVPHTELHVVTLTGLQLRGQAPTVVVSANAITVNPGAGSLSLSSEAITSFENSIRTPGSGALSLSGIAPSTEIDHFKTNATTALSLAGAAPAIFIDHPVFPTAGLLELLSVAPITDIDHFKTNATASIGIASDAPAALVDNKPSPAAASLEIASDAPTSLEDSVRATGGDSLALASSAPEIFVGFLVMPGAGALSIGALAPILGRSRSPTTGSLTINGQAPTVEVLAVNPVVMPGVVALSISGDVPVINVANSGTAIINVESTTSVPNNYDQCDFSGFRQLPGSLKFTWNNYAVRRKSWEERHPQDFVRSTSDKQRGPKRPEQDDRFIGDEIDEITQDDL